MGGGEASVGDGGGGEDGGEVGADGALGGLVGLRSRWGGRGGGLFRWCRRCGWLSRGGRRSWGRAGRCVLGRGRSWWVVGGSVGWVGVCGGELVGASAGSSAVGGIRECVIDLHSGFVFADLEIFSSSPYLHASVCYLGPAPLEVTKVQAYYRVQAAEYSTPPCLFRSSRFDY